MLLPCPLPLCIFKEFNCSGGNFFFIKFIFFGGVVEKFLYLTEVEWADTWVNGGGIPILLASSYLSEKREGIFTPDENLIHKSSFPIPELRQFGIHIEGVQGLNMSNNSFNGRKMPELRNASYYHEDGLILSFCDVFSVEIARKMGKKVCVKIFNIENLGKVIDKQVGSKGIMRNCKYTYDHQRNHFLKSKEDEWQREYRLFWKKEDSVRVEIPTGTAELVTILE
ncbi:unknown protein [Desulfotalea psychrophila LSv54]|uniref:Uncharacterized protein n=1 Tax=Desulfotalea psychrophila (strain LSv54 / DSM 12343) TaxID=177439 RepID=Q6AMI1_DESPS|nr:unknown protein [Desulfotalea psychrophila LSv54]